MSLFNMKKNEEATLPKLLIIIVGMPNAIGGGLLSGAKNISDAIFCDVYSRRGAL